MKIGILTLFGDNYGATLQAYALFHKLSRLGFSAEIINYYDADLIYSSLSKKRRTKNRLRRLMCRVLTGNEKHKRFEAFRREHIKFSDAVYTDHTLLKHAPPVYDIYVSGSDQVWNPELYSCDLNYLMDFTPDCAVRISYASSFGIPSVPDTSREDLVRLLKRYRNISVREKSGAAIVGQLTGINAEICLDPTLLLSKDDWSALLDGYSGKHTGTKYILCYIMPGDRTVCSAISRIAAQLSKQTGLPVMKIGQKEYHRLAFWDRNDVCAGPLDFIALFLNAGHIVTNSMHGVAFAVNFRKPVYIPINKNIPPEKALYVRLTDLLESIGLYDSIVWLEPGKAVSVLKTAPDYTAVNVRLEQMREHSVDYLVRALQKD